MCENILPVSGLTSVVSGSSSSSTPATTAKVPATETATPPADATKKSGKTPATEGTPSTAQSGKGKGNAPASNAKNNVAGGGGDTGTMPALEGAEMGKVVTRFPPEPSGYLHIGHVKAVLLNDFYARHYQGKLIIRFDDTNPSKEKEEFEANIIADLRALGVIGDFHSHTSDYFDLIEEYARHMIRSGKAFMDDTPQEKMRDERNNRIDSVHRNTSIEENLARFETMLKGGEEGSKWCMRAKINMQDDNGTLRDPVMYRVNETPHHRTGTRYKAYPTYDFACPIVDSIEGVTHALRTNEYHDRDAQYEWIQIALGVRKVIIHEFSRLNFIYTLLSKRKLNWFVDNKIVEGWFDPRFPTVQGVLRRGCVLPALREFIIGQGASKKILDMEWDKFWNTNKKHIDPVAPRYTALVANDKIKVHVTGEGTPAVPEVRSQPLHMKNPDVGTKAVYYSATFWLEGEDVRLMKENEEITVMKWGNVIIRKIHTNADGSISHVDAETNLGGDYKKTEKKVTWIADVPQLAGTHEAVIPLVLQDFDYLITVPKLDEGDDFQAAINKVTKIETLAIGEPAMRNLQAGDIIQLERKGFYRVDRPYMAEDRPMVLIYIPDGRVKTWGVGSPSSTTSTTKSPATTSNAAATTKPAKK